MRRTATGTARASLLLLVLSLLVPACATRAARPLPDTVTPEYLLSKITYDGVSSLRSGLVVRVFRDDELFASFTGVLNFRRPALLSSALFGPFGVTVMKVVAADGSLELFVPARDTLYTSEFRASFILPDSATMARYRAELTETSDDFVLTFYRPEGSETVARYHFARKTHETRLVELFREEKVALRLVIEETGPDNLPVRFSLTNGSTRFAIVMEKPEVNAEVPDEAFAHIEAARVLPLQDFLRTLAPHQ